jgi:glutathione peroxidase
MNGGSTLRTIARGPGANARGTDLRRQNMMMARFMLGAALMCGTLVSGSDAQVAQSKDQNAGAKTPTTQATTQPTSLFEFTMKNIDGADVALKDFKGDVLLIVNTASKCGMTPQYAEFEEIYREYKQQGFRVLAFPANNFGQQEPGTNQQIKEFCNSVYPVTFPLFAKISVKGDDIHPLYRYLTSEEASGGFAGAIPWNFTKFLVDRNGRIIRRFEPNISPKSQEVTDAIKHALRAPKP